MESKVCQSEFLVLRNAFNRKLAKADVLSREEVIIDNFNDICLRASKDDPIAQDFLAYCFKKGVRDVIPVNWEKYMQWQILAGANGNEFAIDKLALFFNYAFNEIMLADDLEYIIQRNDITKDNFTYVVGRLLCEAMADDMMLSPEKLLKEKITSVEFNAKLMRTFDRSRNYAIPKVLKFLRN